MRALTYKQEVGIRHVNVTLENFKKKKKKEKERKKCQTKKTCALLKTNPDKKYTFFVSQKLNLEAKTNFLKTRAKKFTSREELVRTRSYTKMENKVINFLAHQI